MFVATASYCQLGCIDDPTSPQDPTFGETESDIMFPNAVGIWDLPGVVKVTDLHTPGDPNTYMCTGTMISDTAILMAAHCVCQVNWVGGNSCSNTATVNFRKDPFTGGSGASVAGTVVSDPNYNPSWSESQIEHDHAIVTIPYGSKPYYVTPFRLASANPSTGTSLVVAGYGDTGYNCGTQGGTILNWGSTSVDHYEDAGEIVDTGPTRTCHGDSGGPILLYDSSLSPNRVIAVDSMVSAFSDDKSTTTAGNYSWIQAQAPNLPQDYPAWQWFTNQQANDIGVNPTNGTSAWIITNTSGGGGNFTIARWNYAVSPPNGGWETMPGAAVRIAVNPAGEAWVINSANQIFRWSNSSGAWAQMPGYATDIGIGGNGDVWVIGAGVVGNNSIYKWNGSGWTQIDGSAVRISVDPSGNPWVVAADGTIWRRYGGVYGYWQGVQGWAADIGIGGDGTVWVLGGSVSGGYQVWRWNGSGWVLTQGVGTAISAATGAKAWVVNASHQIYRGL